MMKLIDDEFIMKNKYSFMATISDVPQFQYTSTFQSYS